MKSESPFNPGDLLAGYFRDSGHEEQELSCDQQERFARAWCAEHGVTLSKVFRDEARKGSTLVGRQKFHEMMHYFSRDKGQRVPEKGLIIWKFSRFARDQDDSTFYIADLRRRDFIVHSLKDNIPVGPMGRLFEAVIHWSNERFLADLSEDVKRGLYDLVTTHRCVPGVAPRGIRRIPVEISIRRDGTKHIAHRWEPDPEWVSRIQRAFELKARGVSLDVIRTETGLYRSVNSYKTFFSNKIWLGILEFGDELVIPNYCQPVVSQELWDEVQLRLREHANKQHVRSERLHPSRKNSRFLLSGLLFCPRCGGAMSGFPSRNGYGKLYDRYGCGKAKRNKNCDMPTLPRYGLENAVISELVEHVLQPEVMSRLLHELETEAAGQEETVSAEKAEFQKRLAGIRKALENVAGAIEARGHSEVLLNRLGALETDQAALQEKLSELNGKEIVLPDETEAELHLTARELRAALREGDEPTQQLILRGLVQKIVVDKWGKMMVGNIWFYFPPENPLPPEKTSPQPGELGTSADLGRRSRWKRGYVRIYKQALLATTKNKPR